MLPYYRLHLVLLLVGWEEGWLLPPSGYSIVTLRVSWLQDHISETDCICCGWPHILFHIAYAFSVCPSGCQPTHLLPPVYRGASYLRNPWLTARSKVNMWHMDSNLCMIHIILELLSWNMCKAVSAFFLLQINKTHHKFFKPRFSLIFFI